MGELLSQLTDLRILTLGEIDIKSIEIIKRDMMSLAIKSADPIIILIDSPGGSVNSGFSLIDFMSMLDVSTVGIVNGWCGSMAVPVLQACTYRWATKHSRLFLHAVSATRKYNVDDDLQEVLKDNARTSELSYKEYLDYLCKRAKKTREEIDRTLKLGDKYGGTLSTQDALEWGFIDKIIEPGEFKLLRRVQSPRPALVPLNLA